MDTDRSEQLALLADDVVAGHVVAGHRTTAWRLDEATRKRGQQGVAAARRALAEAAASRSVARTTGTTHSQAA